MADDSDNFSQRNALGQPPTVIFHRTIITAMISKSEPDDIRLKFYVFYFMKLRYALVVPHEPERSSRFLVRETCTRAG
jgi:hypothetical protein